MSVNVRRAQLFDLAGILEVQRAAWGESAATPEMYESRITTSPEGIFVAEIGEKIVGVVATYSIKGYDPEHPIATWEEATAGGMLRDRYDPDGETMYGVDLAADPTVEHTEIGARLVAAGLENAAQLGKKMVVLGTRLPSYHKHSTIPLDQYVRTRICAVVGEGGAQKADVDPSMVTRETRWGWHYLDEELDWFTRRFQRDRTFGVYGALPCYFPDPDSLDNAALIIWHNPLYQEK